MAPMWHRQCLGAILIAAICAVAFGSAASAQIGPASLDFDADLEWRTLTTEHFRIHFHNGLEGVARQVSSLAEDAYTRLRDEFGEAPATIDLVLTDPFDFPNGFSNPVSDQVAIFASHRELSEIFNVRPEFLWTTLVTHELVHAVEQRQTRGIHDLLERLFGNIITPNAVKPIPFVEGLAVYEKHEIVEESRLNDSRTRMMIRQMVLDNDFPTWAEIRGFNARNEWPSLGQLVYNYSAWLMAYLEETHGDDALQRFTDANADKPLQISALFGMGPKFSEITQEAFGVSPETMYANFTDWLRTQFVPEIRSIREAGVLTGRSLTDHGFSTDDPAWSSQDLIAYTHSDPSRNGLRVVRSDGTHDTEIVAGAASDPAWSPDGQTLVFSRREPVDRRSIRSDLYRVSVQTDGAEIESSEPERLTHGERAYSPAFSPDGETLYYAKQANHAGQSALMARDMASGETRTVRNFADMGAVIQSLSVSPDGERIALALWRPGGYQDIYTMPADGGELTALTQNANEDSDPAWSPEGQYVVFNSDLERRDDLFAIDVDSGESFRITNAMSGAFAPTVSPDGRSLAYLGYDGDGYDVARLPLQPEQWRPVELPQTDVPAWDGYPTHGGEPQPYDPIPLMTPKLWIPTPLQGGFGVMTMGTDPLLTHAYSATLGWDLQSERPVYALSYQNNGSLPLTVSASGNRARTSVGLDATVPLEVSSDRNQTVNLGYRRLVKRAASTNGGSSGESSSEADSSPNRSSENGADASTSSSTRTTTTLSGQYIYDAAHRSERFAHSSNVSISGELINVETLGEWYQRLTLSWSEAVRLPLAETHRVSLDVRGGWTDSPHDAERFALGGPTLAAPMTGGGFTVRGFGPSVAQGQQAVTASVQYDFPLFQVDRTVNSRPVLVDEVGGGVFVDAGMAGDTLNPKDVRIGYGAQLQVSLTLGYRSSVALVGGIGQGLGEDRPRAYLDVQLPQLF